MSFDDESQVESPICRELALRFFIAMSSGKFRASRAKCQFYALQHQAHFA